MNEIIKLENVVKMDSHSHRVLSDVSFTVYEKQRVRICGAPGSGKTALMELIAGMEKPSDGDIFVLGESVHEMDPEIASDFRNRNIGIMQSTPCFLEYLSVLDNVALPLAIRGISAPQRNKAAMEQMKIIGFAHIAHASPAQLSHYEAHMVSLARALIAQPRILLLDEITAYLSERETDQMLAILNTITNLGGFTCLAFCTTDSQTLNTSRCIQLVHGKIREVAS